MMAKKAVQLDQAYLMDQGLVNFFAGDIKKRLKNIENYLIQNHRILTAIIGLPRCLCNKINIKIGIHNMQLYFKDRDSSQDWDSCYQRGNMEIVFDKEKTKNYLRCVTKHGEKYKRKKLG